MTFVAELRCPFGIPITVVYWLRSIPAFQQWMKLAGGSLTQLGEIVLLAMSFHDFFMAHLVDYEPSLMVRVVPLSAREAQCLEMLPME